MLTIKKMTLLNDVQAIELPEPPGGITPAEYSTTTAILEPTPGIVPIEG